MPTLQTIGLGAAANDGTGDNLRAGGQKINDNFTALNNAIGSQAYEQNNLLVDNEPVGDSLNKIDVKFGLTDIYLPLWYGVFWDVTNTSPTLTRIGNTAMHASLPLQSQMRGCLKANDGTTNYFLKDDDWSKKEDGSASNKDGSDGQVLTRIPAHYFRAETSTIFRSYKLSPYMLPGFTFQKEQYLSSYEASLDRVNLMLSSVVNTTAQFRGGNNTSAWDALTNSLLGKPVTNLSRTNMRTYARNRGSNKWNMLAYQPYKTMFWFFTVEYATKNSQLAVDLTLTPEGYRKGGLGIGVSDANSTEWSNYNGQNPFIPCGSSDSLGNSSGEVSVTINDFGGAGINRAFKVNRYRGIENPFGHIWKNMDGVNIKIQSVASGDQSQLWVADNPADWNDSDYTNYVNRGLLARTSNYVSDIIFGDGAEILPSAGGGGSTQNWCDYFYTNIPGSGESLRTLYWGGAAHYGATAGLASADSINTPSTANARIGSRLCYLP